MVEKKVESDTEISQIQAEILHCISKELSVKEIANYRKTSRNAVYKVLNTLSKNGLIELIGRTHGLTDKGRQSLHSFIGFTNKKRYHDLAIKVEILESPKNWEMKRNQMIRLPYFNKRVQLKNNTYDLFSFGKVGVRTTTKSVIIRPLSLYGDNIEQALVELMDVFFDAVPKIENAFKIKLVKDKKANITIISQEISRLNDPLAKLYHKEGNRLYIKDPVTGEVWLHADYSFSVNELEAISVTKSPEDLPIVEKQLNDWRKYNPQTNSELQEEIRILKERNKQNEEFIKTLLEQNTMSFKNQAIIIKRLEIVEKDKV